MNKNLISLLAIPGSLRPDSSSQQVLKLMESLVPPGVAWQKFEGIGRLPHFDGNENPDHSVIEWRQRIGEADGVLVCSPEYAFGIPGSLKNALDWTVYSGEFSGKALGLVTAASTGEKAHAALQDVFTALGSRIPAGASLLISYIRMKIDAKGNVTDPGLLSSLQNLLDNLLAGIATQRGEALDEKI